MKRLLSYLPNLFLALAVGYTLTLTGCDNAVETEPVASDEDALTAATLTGIELAKDSEGDYSDMVSMASYDSGKNGFGKTTIDTSFNRGNMTVSIYRKFANAAGDSTDRFVEGESVSMVFRRSVDGEYSNAEGRGIKARTGEIHKYNTHTVTGLDTVSEAITINGNGNRNNFHEITHPKRNVKETYELISSSSRTDVVINKNDGDKYPESGTAFYTMKITKTRSKADRTVENTFEKTVKVTFNGTSEPIIEVEQSRYKVDLNTGAVAEVN